MTNQPTMTRKERRQIARKLGITILYDATGKFVAAWMEGWCVFSGPIADFDPRLRATERAAS
jgi:hypothetical protein